nr:PREDICTED: leucine-rich repeat neuronal protein 1-like isoform X1 [Megachile rotundata]
MFSYLCLIGIYILCIIQYCVCDICTMCLCSNTRNEESIIDCHGQNFEDNNMLIPDLLTLNEYQSIDKLILSQNNIINVPGYLLKRLKPMKSLDLSKNLIENIYSSTYMNLNSLEDLNLSKNILTVFDDSLLKVLPTLLTLNVSYNNIHTVQSVPDKYTSKIFSLDFSHNNIYNLSKTFFELVPNLEYLDLSFNKIHSLMDYDLKHLSSLKVIYINNNFLTLLQMQIYPKSLVELHAGYNQITEIFYESSQLQTLNIQHNNISKINTNLTKLENLKYLNIGANMLSDFPNIKLENLKTLDMSDNKFIRIPKTLTIENFPLLAEFNISKNPIQNLTFYSDLKLDSFIANNISTLETISKEAFAKLMTYSSHCLNLTISNNKILSFIHEDTLAHLNLCSLDLSNNRFSYISQKLVLRNNTFVINDINLQGNPFKCNCSLQWILSYLVPNLYSRRADLLDNLRCAWPLQISSMRMIHWYGWEEEIFCSNTSHFNENIIIQVPKVANSQTVKLDSSRGLLIVLGIAITVLSCLIIIGIIWAQKLSMKKRRVNRRF